ncbi:unnamed protein product [Coffea canephora]|uniref:Uncharacterized protein n=1 Tax=Coffea canephora TaxID=49390 RepID=A0A068UDH1_COFCA|nr:unnamed protein product [Coffea canephora]
MPKLFEFPNFKFRIKCRGTTDFWWYGLINEIAEVTWTSCCELILSRNGGDSSQLYSWILYPIVQIDPRV